MMTMLFNSFDLEFYKYPQFLAGIFLTIFLTNFYKVNARSSTFMVAVKNLSNFFEDLNPKFLPKCSLMVLLNVIMSIFFFNFMSVHPYVFAVTSNLSVAMPMILTFWVGTLMFMIFNYWKGFLSHTIPQGCPMYLVMFLFVIEIISTLIRPVTGSMRIIANIMAGHLLMILLSKVVVNLFPAVAVYVILNVAELVIAAIQAYIFATMISLYLCDLR